MHFFVLSLRISYRLSTSLGGGAKPPTLDPGGMKPPLVVPAAEKMRQDEVDLLTEKIR